MATNVEKVQLLGGVAAMSLFTSAQIQIFLDCVGGDVWEAAALALTSLAADKSLLANVVEALNYKGDNRNLAKELRATAKSLQETNAKIPAYASAEQAYGNIGREDVLANEWARQGMGNAP